jgi:hypothetical protein
MECAKEVVVSVSLALIPIVGSIALFSFLAVATWSAERRREREAYYRSEILKKLIETQGPGATSAVEVLREEERSQLRRRREGERLGGLITISVGIGLIAFLQTIGGDVQVHLVGLIPLLVGVALLLYSYLLAPKG